LGELRSRRVMLTRLAVGAVLAAVLLIRMCPWGQEKGTDKGQGIPSAPATSQPVGMDDFSRYNNQVFTAVKVVDGDTIDVNISDIKARKRQAYTRIRLWGIDTPEIPHFDKPAMFYGYEAAEFGRKLMAGKKVRLELVEGYTRDKFGRLLAYVYLADGRMYNELAIKNGFAYAETRFKHPRLMEFQALEKEARDNLRGLWPRIKPSQLPHWYKPSRLAEFWASRGQSAEESPTSAPAKEKRKRTPKQKVDPLQY